MKRLIRANTNTDNIFSLFKELVSLEDIGEKLGEVYSAFKEAQENNQQIDEEDYISVDEWFNNYYSSVSSDCIKQAQEDFDFADKYKNLTTEEENEFIQKVIAYIFDNKDNIVNNIDNEGME